MKKLLEVSTGEFVFSGIQEIEDSMNCDDICIITIPKDTVLYTFLKEDYKRLFDLRFYEFAYNCFLKITWYTDVIDVAEGLIFDCVGGQLVELLDVCENIEQFRDKYDKILYEKV